MEKHQLEEIRPYSNLKKETIFIALCNLILAVSGLAIAQNQANPGQILDKDTNLPTLPGVFMIITFILFTIHLVVGALMLNPIHSARCDTYLHFVHVNGALVAICLLILKFLTLRNIDVNPLIDFGSVLFMSCPLNYMFADIVKKFRKELIKKETTIEGGTGPSKMINLEYRI